MYCIESSDFELPVFYRYVDDIFTNLSADRIDEVLRVFNQYHSRQQFTLEREVNNSLSFLDVTVIRNNNVLITNWYRKPTFSSRYINFFSNHPTKHKVSVVKGLVDGAVLLSDPRFHTANIDVVREILINNSCPIDFIDRHVKKRKKEIRHKTRTLIGSVNNDYDIHANKNNIFIKIPFVSDLSLMVKKSLNKFDVRTVSSIPKKLNNIVNLDKDKCSHSLNGIVYKIDCNNCNACYVGQTKRHLSTRIKEHRVGIKKHVNCHSVVSEYRLHCGHDFDWNDVNVLHREGHTKKREIAEMFFIKRNCNAINSQRDKERLPSIYDNILINTQC